MSKNSIIIRQGMEKAPLPLSYEGALALSDTLIHGANHGISTMTEHDDEALALSILDILNVSLDGAKGKYVKETPIEPFF